MKNPPYAKDCSDDWSGEREETTLSEADVLVLPDGREVRLLEEVKLTFTRRNIHAATD